MGDVWEREGGGEGGREGAVRKGEGGKKKGREEEREGGERG